MSEPSLRDRLLIALRSKLWRSYRQLCLVTCGRASDLEVRSELTRLMGDGLVDFWDNSLRRFNLTCAGRNAAKRAWEAKQRRAAA